MTMKGHSSSIFIHLKERTGEREKVFKILFLKLPNELFFIMMLQALLIELRSHYYSMPQGSLATAKA